MTIGVALVGSGIFAKEAHLPAIKASPDLRLVAAYSRSLKSAQSLGVDVPLYSEDSAPGKTYRDLLKSDQVQAVVIALPILSQPEYIRDALEAGKHVLSEKPIAADVKSAEKLVAWYHKAQFKTTWGVAESTRFVRSVVSGIEKAKDLGKITGFQVRMHSFVYQDGKYFNTEWRKTPEYQGGFLLDGGIHWVAALRGLLAASGDRITRVAAFTKQVQPHLPPIDTLNAIVSTEKGVTGTLSFSFGTRFKERRYLISFEKARMDITDQAVKIDRFDDKDEEAGSTTNTMERIHEVYDEVDVWAKGLASGQMDKRLTVEEGLADLKVLEAMFKSGEQNGTPIDV